MPPKKTAEEAAAATKIEEQLALIIAQQTKMTESMEAMTATINKTEERLVRLEGMLAEAKQENIQLKSDLVKRDAEVEKLQHKIHSLELHNRSFSVRVTKVPITGDITDNENVRQQLYTKAFLPILQGASQAGAVTNIPTANQLIEMAHVLPGKADAPRQIICRFMSRIHKGLIMSLKRDHAPRNAEAAGAAAREGRLKPMLYPIFEDLTKETYNKMREIGGDTRVQSCWSVGGRLRYRLKSDLTVVHKVDSIFDPVVKILG